MISHQAYFEFLSSTDQSAPAWQPVVAGLAVLRLIDSRFAGDVQSEGADWASVESVRSAVTAINEGDPVRAILLSLLDSAGKDQSQRETIGRGLIAYGRALNFEGRWALACDVFSSADSIAGVPAHPGISIDANIALGSAARRIGDWDRSANAYARAAHVADAIGDKAEALNVEVRRATTHIIRGNLPAAETMLTDIIEQARAGGFSEPLGLALHGKATVAHNKGAYADAVRFGYEALEEMGDSAERDSVLSDIGAAFGGMGMLDAARDSYLIVSATSQSQWVRWQAELNLMELAAIDGNEAEFNSYAGRMESPPLDPRLRAYYFLFLGQGQQRFGKHNGAEASLKKAVAFAEANQLYQIAHEASTAIAALESEKSSLRDVVAPPTDIDPSIGWIVSELSSLREVATRSP